LNYPAAVHCRPHPRIHGDLFQDVGGYAALGSNIFFCIVDHLIDLVLYESFWGRDRHGLQGFLLFEREISPSVIFRVFPLMVMTPVPCNW